MHAMVKYQGQYHKCQLIGGVKVSVTGKLLPGKEHMAFLRCNYSHVLTHFQETICANIRPVELLSTVQSVKLERQSVPLRADKISWTRQR